MNSLKFDGQACNYRAKSCCHPSPDHPLPCIANRHRHLFSERQINFSAVNQSNIQSKCFFPKEYGLKRPIFLEDYFSMCHFFPNFVLSFDK